MKISLASVTSGKTRAKHEAGDALVAEFLKRSARYAPCDLLSFASERALLDNLERLPARPAAHAILLDSSGEALTSEEIAQHLGRLRDRSTPRAVFAIGPADGWSPAARKRADLLLSFGRITLPHGLARVVASEQIYRALTILAGHPYHTGH